MKSNLYMDNERPDELLYDYINGHATDAQIKEIMQWAHEDPANMKELELLRRLNDEAIWNASIDAEERQKQERKSAKRRIGQNLHWLMVRSCGLIREAGLRFMKGSIAICVK